jgi:CHAT domain-containing protein
MRAYLLARWRASPHLQQVDGAVQEVFVECFRAGGVVARVDPARAGGFRPVLYGVVRNVARQLERRHAAQQARAVSQDALAAQPADDSSLSAVFDGAWAKAIMRQAAPPARVADGDLPRAARAGSKVSWPALPGTARELERILGLAGKRPATARRGNEASTAKLLHDLPEARWAHLATHGYFADASVRSALQLSEKDYERGRWGERVGVGARSPLVLSGLVLAGANLPIKDPAKEDGGILTAEAIAGLDLDGLELAVLSACETGLGEVAGGEGVFGLQRAFHIAGCQNVIASLWQVDDESTAALMGLFYHHLWTEKQLPLEALRQAQLTLYRHPERIPQLARARGPDFQKAARLPAAPQGATRAPARLWAGFVLSGAGR